MNEIREALEGGLFSGGGGNDEGYNYEASAERVKDTVTFYNGYLGISLTVPAGWWLYSIDEDNFNDSAIYTASPSLLDIYYGEDGIYSDPYYYIYLANIGNLQYSSKSNHIGVEIYAEMIEGVETLDDYVAEYINYVLETYDSPPYTLLDTEQTILHGRVFQQSSFNADQEGRPFLASIMTCEVNDGYYLTFECSYWPENKSALESIRQFLEDGLEFL